MRSKKINQNRLLILITGLFLLLLATPLLASEAELEIPVLTDSQNTLLMVGFLICFLGMAFGAYEYVKVKAFPAHKSMLDVADVIFQTCKTYLIQQGKLLIVLEIFIGVCIAYYFGFLQHMDAGGVILILIWSVVGILGSYGVAWFGIRMNTLANSRMAFASLEGKPIKLLDIPLRAGMSIGVLLVCVELIMMLIILVFMPRNYAGACFIGFAIGESLGASALRICGGIFTKIADIGSDLMKIVFNIKEDDPRNPGVIADCTGDNAGDSVGPTADGFETYGVTGVALISFIVLGVFAQFRAELITWIFVMRILMIITSIVAFQFNKAITTARFAGKTKVDFEISLTMLVWFTSILSILVTFAASYWQIGHLPNNLWFTLSIIISCGTIAAALIPELVKVFTSSKSIHCQETVRAAREGGASLDILSGFVAGNFGAFWLGMAIFILMSVAYFASLNGLDKFMEYSSIFAFGLVAFGFLGMGPVTIAVDSYGPVTDNAQSIYELSLIETIPNVETEIQSQFGFKPNFDNAKHYLEENDSCGNTFKATAKPVLIGTAVVGATTMIFSLILLLRKTLGIQPETILNLLNPFTLLGFLCGGAVIYWFTGASTQAVTTGAYRAVQYIKKNIKLDDNASLSASTEKSKEVVKICTQYAQKGMFNIFIVIFCFALAFAFFSAPGGTNAPASFFISYLISIAVFGLYQAIFMANAGGCWDNAKKVVEVDLKEKGTPLHAATVIGDTVGDPFKDTSSVALNPIIKFTTLFGLLAMEIAISPMMKGIAHYVGGVFFLIACVFVARSFYGMRIPKE
ncbi:MAG: sodium-translocating pyrophosphatase [Deltaproteobacteria bacterium]|jgi:K(+)-stimulated pyrophosphate-energized sodium pump|nr:sodium-translocating pyrophosphatase [Deltaproteobacteria bacterium]